MSAIKRVKKLQGAIKDAQKEIEKIQKKCKHLTIRNTSFPDIYQGLGWSMTCVDCGKFISCGSMPPLNNEPVKKKTWIERKGKGKK